MRLNRFLVVLFVLVLSTSAEAQQTKKVPRIGYLSLQFPRSLASPNIEAFRQQLRELGYVEKQNIIIEWRFANGQPDRLPTLAANLVELKVNVIVTQGNPATRAAKHKTNTIPIVVVAGTDLVGNHLLDNLTHPGENVTGLTTYSHELSGKRLGLLKEIVPKALHFGILHNRNSRALREMNTLA